MLTNTSDPNTKPFLFRFAQKRTEGAELPGAYSNQRGLWLVDSAEGPVPIIEAARELVSITTKTKVEEESDDESGQSLLEISTKTAAAPEGDDELRSVSALLEISTKTEAQLESEDTAPSAVAFL